MGEAQTGWQFIMDTWLVWTFIIGIIIVEKISMNRYQANHVRRRKEFYKRQDERDTLEIEQVIKEINESLGIEYNL